MNEGPEKVVGEIQSETLRVPYTGQEIIEEKSFLRFLPASLNRLQRMRLDALVYSADVLTHSWRTLTEAATNAGPEPHEFTRAQRITMLSSAWAIVDHLNATRQIIQTLLKDGSPDVEEPGLLTRELTRLLEPFREARNKMDHLNQNLPNMSAVKAGLPPMLGSLGYVYIHPQVPGIATSLTVQTGAILGDGWFPIINPMGQKCQLPVGLFQLYAFGQTLELGPPLKALKAWADANTPEWERQVRLAVEEAATRTGKDFEELFAFAPPNLVVAMTFHTEPVVEPSN